jgi:hypothetical protein
MSIANRKPVCDCLIVDSVGGERLSPLSSARRASTTTTMRPDERLVLLSFRILWISNRKNVTVPLGKQQGRHGASAANSGSNSYGWALSQNAVYKTCSSEEG